MRCLAGADTGRNASYRLDGSAAVAAEAWLVARRVGADVATFWSSISEIGRCDGAERLNCSLTCGVGVMAGPSHLARPMAEQTVSFFNFLFWALEKDLRRRARAAMLTHACLFLCSGQWWVFYACL